jgi:hypothetical protein
LRGESSTAGEPAEGAEMRMGGNKKRRSEWANIQHALF